MTRGKPIITSLCALTLAVAVAAWVKPDSLGMTRGPVEAKSFGAMAFGPNNVLFIGDNDGESILAMQIDDNAKATGPIELAGIDTKVAQALGTTPDNITIQDMAVHPSSHNVYLTVMRGKGADAKPVLLRVTRDAKQPIEEVSLANVRHSEARITNAPVSNPAGRSDPHRSTITDLAFADGKVWVAGLSNEQFSSAFRRIPFPFTNAQETTELEIYHYSHKRSETAAPVMTFAPETINGKLYMLAAYTCTPLVAFEASGLVNGQKVVGRTVADLGAGNAPYDIISYTQDGKDYMLIANRNHPMMRVSVADIASAPAITNPDGGDGIARKNESAPGAVVQLSDLDKDNVVVIQKGANGLDLKSILKSTF